MINPLFAFLFKCICFSLGLSLFCITQGWAATAFSLDPITEPTQALVEAEMEIKKTSANSLAFARAVFKKAKAYEALEQYELARTYYQQTSNVLLMQLPDSIELAIVWLHLGQIYNNLGSYVQGLTQYEKAKKIAIQLEQPNIQAVALLGMGTVSWRSGNYEPALEYSFDSLRLFQELHDQEGIANVFHNIGIINDLLKNYNKALEFHYQALALREQLGDKKAIADSLDNIGIVNYFQGNYDAAVEYYQRALNMRTELDDDKGAAKSLNNLGLIYKEQNKYEMAINHFYQSLEIANKMGDKYEIANISNNIGKLFILKKSYLQAEVFLAQAERFAQETNAKDLIRENYEFYSDLYSAQNDFQQALLFYKKSAAIKDQLVNEKSSKSIADLQTQYETEQKAQEIELLKRENNIKQLELERKTLTRNISLFGFIFVFSLTLIMLYLYIVKKRAHSQLSHLYSLISQEKAKTDQLLLNILPARVAHDLKESGNTEPESFEDVTVYFSDIVGFTKTSTEIDPKILIQELNIIFTAFDNIIERNQCERIKTIGDAYLCVCGMPEENPNHAYNIVRSAVEIIEYMTVRNKVAELEWQIRIGIHTGRVVGGVVGVKKYIYDVFGDTINTASRMESNSKPMRINISEQTYQLVKDQFICTERETIEVKGKGDMQMFFVEKERDTNAKL
jgi:class 3 adenylate cyclase